MADFDTTYPKLFGVYRMAERLSDRWPVTSQVAIDGLRRIMRGEGMSDERAEEVFVEAGGALLVQKAIEIAND